MTGARINLRSSCLMGFYHKCACLFLSEVIHAYFKLPFMCTVLIRLEIQFWLVHWSRPRCPDGPLESQAAGEVSNLVKLCVLSAICKSIIWLVDLVFGSVSCAIWVDTSIQFEVWRAVNCVQSGSQHKLLWAASAWLVVLNLWLSPTLNKLDPRFFHWIYLLKKSKLSKDFSWLNINGIL